MQTISLKKDVLSSITHIRENKDEDNSSQKSESTTGHGEEQFTPSNFDFKNPHKVLEKKIAYQNGKKIVLNLIKKDVKNFKKMGEKYKNDKEILLFVVKKQGKLLKYASKELKNNKEVVSLAVQQNGLALQHASEKLKNNKDIVLQAVKHQPVLNTECKMQY